MQLADNKKDLNMQEICKLFVGSIFIDAMLNYFHFVNKKSFKIQLFPFVTNTQAQLHK